MVNLIESTSNVPKAAPISAGMGPKTTEKKAGITTAGLNYPTPGEMVCKQSGMNQQHKELHKLQ
jgi:hypothetical protein